MSSSLVSSSVIVGFNLTLLEYYSQRIWGNTQKLADNLKEDLLSGILSGKSGRKIAEDIAKRYNVSIYNAERLVRTETNYIANQAEIESYKESGIEKYRFVATLDSRTSEICQQFDGQEFSVSDAQAGVNLPPMHAHCRSTTISVINDKCLENLERCAKNPDGTTSKVPADMSYKEWKDTENVKRSVLGKYNLSQGLTNADNSDNISLINPEYLSKFNSELEKMNISVSGFENYKGDIKVLDEALDSLKKMQQEFPKIFSGFELKYEIHNDFDSSTYAGYVPYENVFYLNPLMYDNTQKLIQSYTEDVKQHFHPSGTDYRANIFHEFGHYVETIADIKIKRLAKDLYEKNHGGWFNRKLGDDWIAKELSIYASEKDYDELIAESFAEYYGSENPKQLCKDVMEEVLKILKEKGII